MILSRHPVAGPVAIVLGAWTLVACGGTSSGDDGSDGPQVLATTSIWADVTSATLCGHDVPAVVPAGADAHTFEPSLRDREMLEAADIVIANGGGLEETLTDLLATVAANGTNLVEMTPWVDTIVTDDDHDHDTSHEDHDDEDHDDEDHDDEDHDDEDHDDEDHDASHEEHDDEAGDDGHGHDLAVDPHLWQDPNRVISTLQVIASAAAPLNLGDCSEEYGATLTELDAELEEILAVVPAESRVMVTSHDSLAYFADRYGFEIVGTVIPSTSTLTETNAADLAALADTIDDRGVRAIFTEELGSNADADALAERLGVRVVPLLTDALSSDPATDTYVEMMRANATAIAGALAP